MFIDKIDVKTDHRCLRAGFSIGLKNITLLVGDQGSGKSTLLECLHEYGKGTKDKVALVLTEKGVKGVSSFYFDAEKHNPRIRDPQDYTTVTGKSIGFGYGAALASRWKSHGEVLKKFTVDAIKQATNCIVMLDEPEAGLSLKSQFLLVKNILERKDVQFIIATHCLPLIQAMDEVYSMDHLKWMASKDFINSQEVKL